MSAPPVLAIDLGGTKIAAGLVAGAVLLDRRETRTERDGRASAWIDAIARLVEGWQGYQAAGVAVTGLVQGGLWRALNLDTLAIPGGFPLGAVLTDRLGVPVLARNDAQAAAWGEFRFGAGQGADIAFVTVSTGIGGGVVLDGRLLGGRAGLAGHFGITPVHTPDGVRLLEEIASGSVLDKRAGAASAVTAAAHRGEAWAEPLLDGVVAPLALALRRVQLVLDPDRIVIGGGLGLAPGYLDRLHRHLDPVPVLQRPVLFAAALGADAGLIGIADLAEQHFQHGRMNI